MIISHIIFTLLILRFHAQYNHQSAGYLNTTWMAQLDNGIPLRKLSIIGSHSSMGTGAWGDAFQTQSNSLMGQMKMGIRALDIRCRHYQNSFPIHDRLAYLNTDLGAVLSTVTTFLQTYPMETILMHIVEEYSPSGNSRTFQQTFISYKNQYVNIIWNVTTQNPVLGEVRGKIVIIQDFSGVSIHGLMYSTFTVLPHKWYNTNWDQYDKWVAVKNFLTASNSAGDSRISFWTGHGGSFPYFVASGKLSPGNSAPLLSTALTTPGFKNSYPDFPRVACFIGICTIAFEGINILASNYINSQSLKYLGIVFTDFIGDVVIQKSLSLNIGQFTPCPAALTTQGCSYCTSAGQCLGCNSTLHYLYNSLSFSCDADKGYYLLWANTTSNAPAPCGIPLIGCLQCSSSTVCTLCDSLANYQVANGTCQAAPGYYLNSTSIPVKCALVGCYICASSSTCTTCSAATNFIMNNSTQTCMCDSGNNFQLFASTCICKAGYYLTTNGTCDIVPLCPANNSGCSNCSIGATTSCSLCDVANNYQTAGFNSSYCICKPTYYFTGSSCNLCNTTLTNACNSCVSSSICLSCNTNFTLFEGTCSCLPQYYLFSPGTCLLCQIGCLRCTSGSLCLTCDSSNNFTLVSSACQCNSGLFLNQSLCIPCGAMPGCLTCNNMGCTSCNPVFGFSLNATANSCQCNFGFFSNAMNICQPCPQLGCSNCISLATCIQCDTTYFYLSAGICNDICGDGFLYNLPCDDGNLQNGDGCSSACLVQTDYTCVGGTTTTPSLCSFSGTINLQISSFIKDPSKNMVYLTSKISPNLNSFNALDFNTVFIPSFITESSTTVFDSASGNITMVFTYNQSLNSQKLSVLFVPPAIPAYFYMPKVSKALPYTTDNNLALKTYTAQQYNLKSTIQLLCVLLAYSSLGIFLICFLVVSKLMAIEMIFILQIAYTSLLYLQKLELYMNPLRNLWIVNGYNQLFSDATSSLPGRVSQIYYKGEFLSNFSIDILIIFLPIAFGLIFLTVGKARRNKANRMTSYKILKEWLISALLFVQLHLNISICLGINYSQSKSSLVFGGIIEILLFCQLIIFLKSPKNFGQYTQFFEPNGQSWYLVVIIYRSLLAFVTGFLGSEALGMYASLGLASVFLIAQLIKKPYKSNVRPAINCLFILAILAIYTISKVFQDSSSIYIYTSYTPIFLISLLFLALIFNVVFMIMRFVASCRNKEEKALSQKIMNDNEQESLKMDKVYINEIKQNLKDSLMLTKVLDKQRIEPQKDDGCRIDMARLKHQIKINAETNEVEILQNSGVRCRANSESDDQLDAI